MRKQMDSICYSSEHESGENTLPVGIVRTSVIVTGVQVCSRIFMVWFITSSIRQVRGCALPYLVSTIATYRPGLFQSQAFFLLRPRISSLSSHTHHREV